MGIYGGLKQEDWQRWGQFTTFKQNAAALLGKALRPDQRIYCSPLVDPYQPAEAPEGLMREILAAVAASPPRVFVIQTRGPLILRDLDLLKTLAERTCLRVSFSLTTNRESVRKLFEPHCEPLETRLAAMRELRAAGIATYATLAPLLPCDPEELAAIALRETDRDIIGDPLHVRASKRQGATTRTEAFAICEKHGFEQWLEPEFHDAILARIQVVVTQAGRGFAAGTKGFSWLAQL
jgi:DNA repair photolyase